MLKKLKNDIRSAKRTQWRTFCEEVEGRQATTRFHKLMANDPLASPGTLKTADGSFTSNDAETLKALMDVHFPGVNTAAAGTVLQSFLPSTVDQTTILSIVGVNRVEWAVNSFSPWKSSGPDEIFPAMLQHGLDLIIRPLSNLFEASLRLNHIPATWTRVKVVFIPKQGRSDYTSPKAYRPISLSSFLLKTLERLIDRYARDNFLIQSPLHPSQHAYQTGKCTESALHQLVYNIEDGMERSGFSLVTFLDIEGAFDNT